MRTLRLLTAAGLLLAPAHAAERGPDFDGKSAGRGGSALSAARSGAGAPDAGSITSIDDRSWITVSAPGRGERTRAASLGLSIEQIEDGTVGGVAGPETIRRLEAAGLKVLSTKPLRSFGPEGFPSEDAAFHDYGEVQAELKSIASALPGLATTFPIGQSHGGRELTALRLHRDDGSGQAKPGIAFLGTHHAREHLSTEVPLGVARWLAERQGDARVRRLLDTRDIYFIPLVNPDGAEYDVETGRYQWQRKNMRDNGDGTVGVDLNRNYGYRFGGPGASDDPGSDTYHGPGAFSEPESQAVRAFLTARPNIRIALSYHTFSELVLYPWGGTEEPISDGRALGAFKAMAERMAGWTGYRPMQSSDLYVATGDTCDWAWAELQLFCFTFELTPKSMWQGGFYPGAGAIQTTIQKNIEPALYLIELADDPYRAGGAAAAAPQAPESAPRRKT